MLPKTDYPIYDFTIPSTKKVIQFRPFVVRDKRNLLIALETKDDKETTKAVKQLATNCILDPTFDVDSMASFDLELFFLNLKARSDSEVVEGVFICELITDEETQTQCGGKIKVSYNVLETKLTETEGHTKKIMFSATTGVVMKYPTFSILEKFDNLSQSAASLTFEFIADCVDYFFDADNIYKAADLGPEVIREYLDTLEVTTFAKIEAFFDTMPVLKKDLIEKCPKCNGEHKIALEGLQSFFA